MVLPLTNRSRLVPVGIIQAYGRKNSEPLEGKPLSERLLCSTQSPKGSCGVRERTTKFQKGLKISTKTKKTLISGFPNIFDIV